jgi:RNA polymerase sigma-70 factor (ECF subfamily)
MPKPEASMSADLALQNQVQFLYSHHHSWLLGWLRRRLGDACVAADLAHDTFVRVLARRALLEFEEPKAYLATIARGLLVDHWRRQDIERAWLDTLAAMPEPVAPSPEERSLLLEALCRIDALLDQLRPKVRETFLLSQIDGLTYREIGERLGVGERMVKKYLAQAMLHCLRADAAA